MDSKTNIKKLYWLSGKNYLKCPNIKSKIYTQKSIVPFMKKTLAKSLMTEDEFWKIIANSLISVNSLDEQQKQLKAELSKLT